MRKIAIAVVLVLTTVLAQAQDKKPLLSPRQNTSYSFADGKKVTVDYGAPSVRGRKIMGGQPVPYDKVWRTGANEATSFVTDTDLMIGSTKVPAGKYTLYTLPTENAWQLIINKQTGQWGTVYNQDQDLARIPMKLEKTSAPVEMMKFSFDGSGGTATTMNIEWENTKVSVPIKETK